MFQHELLKRIFILHENYLCFFVKDQFIVFAYTCVGTLYSAPLVYLSVLLPRLHYHAHCSLRAILEFRECHSFHLVLFQFALTILGLLPIHLNLRNYLVAIHKITHCHLAWDCVESTHHFGKNWQQSWFFSSKNREDLSIYSDIYDLVVKGHITQDPEVPPHLSFNISIITEPHIVSPWTQYLWKLVSLFYNHVFSSKRKRKAEEMIVEIPVTQS